MQSHIFSILQLLTNMQTDFCSVLGGNSSPWMWSERRLRLPESDKQDWICSRWVSLKIARKTVMLMAKMIWSKYMLCQNQYQFYVNIVSTYIRLYSCLIFIYSWFLYMFQACYLSKTWYFFSLFPKNFFKQLNPQTMGSATMLSDNFFYKKFI